MNDKKINIGVGIPSILMIFIVVCLTIFGILSLKTAKNDERLTNMNLERSENYYKARLLAEEQIMKIQADLVSNSFNSSQYSHDASGVYEMSVDALNDRKITTKFVIDDKKITIISQCLQSSKDWEVDDKLDLWLG